MPRFLPIVLLTVLRFCFADDLVQSAHPLRFIDTSFANASPIDWEVLEDGRVRIDMLYDHERESPNRAALHWHFRIEADPGSDITMLLNNFHNVWNGRPGLAVDDKTIAFTSEDGNDWLAKQTEFLEADGQLQFTVRVPASGSLYVARLPAYHAENLERLISDIRNHPMVEITPIGKTVQGRPLEIIRVGDAEAANRVFMRARAHPWEAGGNWVVEGMIRHLIEDRGTNRPSYFDSFCLYVMPMANKDGVAMGRSRFNMFGKDLNRDWDAPADAALCPENDALERWLTTMLADGKRPHLALEMHNDASGKLHLSRPVGNENSGYLQRMAKLESLLRQKTWFREGATDPSFNNPGTLGDGWLSRYGIDAVVHELNANWIEGLGETPSSENWMLYGRQLCDVFEAYFE
ncbi:M14 family zinc carboxypeptidase [Rubripirellula amarantea]|nr:M14 family zinc carboxypeptidase [Rubripirellula amarantea]